MAKSIKDFVTEDMGTCLNRGASRRGWLKFWCVLLHEGKMCLCKSPLPLLGSSVPTHEAAAWSCP